MTLALTEQPYVWTYARPGRSTASVTNQLPQPNWGVDVEVEVVVALIKAVVVGKKSSVLGRPWGKRSDECWLPGQPVR